MWDAAGAASMLMPTGRRNAAGSTRRVLQVVRPAERERIPAASAAAAVVSST
jgi:hypothetical protein